MAFTAPTTKSQAYDHAAYITPVEVSLGGNGTMASGAISRYTAFTNMILKTAVLSVGVAGTNTSTVAIIRVTAAGTATSTLASVIIGTGVVSGTSIGTAAGQYAVMGLGTTTVLQGDVVGLLNGIDATAQLSVGIEAYIVPGANLTV